MPPPPAVCMPAVPAAPPAAVMPPPPTATVLEPPSPVVATSVEPPSTRPSARHLLVPPAALGDALYPGAASTDTAREHDAAPRGRVARITSDMPLVGGGTGAYLAGKSALIAGHQVLAITRVAGIGRVQIDSAISAVLKSGLLGGARRVHVDYDHVLALVGEGALDDDPGWRR